MAYNSHSDVEKLSNEPNPKSLMEAKGSLPFSESNTLTPYLFSAQAIPEFNLLFNFS
jgi:hypothetical protein